MKTNSRILIGVGIGIVVAAGAAISTVYSGLYDVAADVPHTRPVFALLEIARERSVARRAQALPVPANLDDPARIRQGAGNYDAMCVGCHLSPGSGESELSRGLYPAPPDLTRETVDAATAFWTIKHGIKASGMPAWGKSMGDEYIWNIAAFLQALPALDKAGYAALVAGSEGHSHSGGETSGQAQDKDRHGGHEHGGTGREDHHPEAAESPPSARGHTHADGSQHLHQPESPASSTTSASPPPEPHDDSADSNLTHEDSHDHEH